MTNDAPLSQPNPTDPQCPVYDFYRELIGPDEKPFSELTEDLQQKWNVLASVVFEMMNAPLNPKEELLPRCPACRMLMRVKDFVGTEITFAGKRHSMILCKHCRTVIAIPGLPEKSRILNPTQNFPS